MCSSPEEETICVPLQDEVQMTCRVNASPGTVNFTWYYISNSDNPPIQLPDVMYTTRDHISVINYSVMTVDDFGYLHCYASNDLGTQESPCVFSVIPTQKPDPLENCTVVNQTSHAFSATCLPGNDGGLEQEFIIQVFQIFQSDEETPQTKIMVVNITEMEPNFTVEGLQSDSMYVLAMYAVNTKGMSKVTQMHGYTLPSSDLRGE